MENVNRAQLREEGKQLYFHADGDAEKKKEGLKRLVAAQARGDAEASFILGVEMLRGRLAPLRGERVEKALDYLAAASRNGSMQARALLNQFCETRYRRAVCFDPAEPAPLTGFDGRAIRIRRKGLFVPVDAELHFDGTINILTLSANIHFVYLSDNAFDRARYEAAILRGIRDWEGEYEVFGGQKLRLELELSTEQRIRDSIHIIPFDEELSEAVESVGKYTGKEKRERLMSCVEHRRSFAGIGIGRWSVHTTKTIYMQSASGRFDDEDALRNTAKHEFGHVLGVGDMYASEVDSLGGVPPDKYGDIAAFHLYDQEYYMVMCDENAPVSNNDVEMVVLAFSENRFQRFQPDNTGKKISDALGKGN